ncbi:MAG: hypothetical protein GWP19_00180 [Planctomycetia bacterium]|nr:hypothetical protein [Planctomycetia bacterium]
MPRLHIATVTDSNIYGAIQDGDDLIFRKVKPKITDIHWWIHLVSWPDHCAKAVWIDKDSVRTLHAIGTYGYIALIQKRGKWVQKKRYAVLYVPIEILLDKYEGTNVYWCPLSDEMRANFDSGSFQSVCQEMEGVPYDYWRFIGVGIDDEHIDWLMKGLKYLPFYRGWWGKYLKRIFRNSETISKVVCSGFTSYADRVSLGINIPNISEMTPQDQAERQIHDSKNYYQILGQEKLGIPNYNTEEIT